MFGEKSQIVAVVTLTSCVVLFWRYESSNQIQRTKYCIDDNTNSTSIANFSDIEFEQKMAKDIISVPNIFDYTTRNHQLNNTLTNKPFTSNSRSNPINLNNSTNKNNNLTTNSRKTQSNLIVETKGGKLRGKKLSVLGSNVYAFIGIRYAEPPIGNLRFSSSVSVKPWRGVRAATQFTYMCPHQILRQELVPMNYISERLSEDCLSLNIWTPDLSPKQLKTVMVWIHGGAFNFNSANLHETDGRVLSSFGDVVVVAINYRVGALGFLNTRTTGAPGNMGLYDQALGLEWVKDNIDKFGGDPNKLVLFGESAGAISVGILMAFNRTKHLFSRAITQSGGALLPGVFYAQTFSNSQKFARLSGCSTNKDNLKLNPQKVVNCLKSAPLERIMKAEAEMIGSSQLSFVPTPDGAFKDIKDVGSQLESPNLFSNMKELLTGVNPDEGAWLLHVTDPENFRRHSYTQLRTNDETKKEFIRFTSEKVGLPQRIATIVANSLINGPEIDSPENNIQRIITVSGDNSITCPTIFMADEFVARNKTVYAYLFNQRAKANKFGKWQGISHYEEVPFVFGYPLRRTKSYSKPDIDLSKRMMKVWTHFAKTGEALPQLGLNWPKYSDNESYMVLQANQSSIINSFHERNCEIFKASFSIFS